MKIGIIGSGKFGLVLASIAMENNNEVVIFSRRKQEVDSINTNKKSLSGFSLEGGNCFATNNHEDLNSCDALLFSVGSICGRLTPTDKSRNLYIFPIHSASLLAK